MSKVFSLEEVGKHNTGKDCWMIIHNKVLYQTRLQINPCKESVQ